MWAAWQIPSTHLVMTSILFSPLRLLDDFSSLDQILPQFQTDITSIFECVLNSKGGGYSSSGYGTVMP